MRLCVSLLLFTFIAPLMGAPIPTDKRAEMFYGIAQGNYLIGDESGAAKGIEETLRIQADYLPALKLKARLLLDQGESEAALAITEQAIALAPADLENQLLKALVLGNLNRRDESIAIIQQVLSAAQAGSNDTRAANQLLGLLRMAEENWDEAAEAFNQNYIAAPDSSQASLKLASEAYIAKARSAMAAQETDTAVLAIDQAIALHKNATGTESLRQRSELRLLRARALTQAGRTEEAITDLQALTGLEPNNLEALVTLASR